ncbi:hypothetical protein HMPREF1583_00706 [Gardnerella vaginalis JCP8151B]|nr:hypothetical protein HMPREF1583_00706 [Gardnerella vaginalis JCP8151B]
MPRLNKSCAAFLYKLYTILRYKCYKCYKFLTSETNLTKVGQKTLQMSRERDKCNEFGAQKSQS